MGSKTAQARRSLGLLLILLLVTGARLAGTTAQDATVSQPGVSGNTYVSPAYGYALTWDDTWTATESTSDEGGDTLRITNGLVTADLYALHGDFEANQCNDQLLEFFQGSPAYRDAELVTDTAGEPLVSGNQDVAFALISLTYVDDQGVATDYYDYTTCAVLPDRQSLVALDQFVSPGDYAGQVEAMEALQAGLAVSQGTFVSPGGLREGERQAPTIDAASETAYRAVLSETEGQVPVFGPIGGELALDQAGGGVWPAVVSVTDFRIHVELEPPVDATETGWAFAIEFRDAGYGFDAVVVEADGSWTAAGLTGTIEQAPVSVDLVAQGEKGYLGINGHPVAALDLSWIMPGDITLGTGETGVAGSVLGVKNWTIWELLPEGISGPRPASALVSDDDIRTFNEIRFYPLQSTLFAADGSMLPSAGDISYAHTGVEVTDFGAEIDCLVPEHEGLWDCGLVFRDVLSENHYQVVVVSDGTWSLTTGAGDLIQSGSSVPLLTKSGELNKLHLYVVGDVGYFGVNGVLIAKLDLAQIPGAGSVSAGTSFTADTAAEGGETFYEDFVVWMLDAGLVDALTSEATPES